MYKRLGFNIKALRKSFGETQSDLLYAIGMEGSSPSTISQYENGDRIPERDTLIKIAKHYRITEDELINGDFSHLQDISKNIANDKEKNKKMLDKLFPMISNDNALKNKCFEQAYNIHVKLYQDIVNGIDFDEIMFEKCLELYEKAKADGIIEACANILWWNMLVAFSFSFITPAIYGNPAFFKKEKLTIKEVIKNGFLPSFEDGYTEEEKELFENRKAFIEDSQIQTIVNIYKLKHSKEYSQLGDYYLALRHKFGLITSSLSFEMNSAIGDEMLFDFSLMDNPYAKKFFEDTEKEW